MTQLRIVVWFGADVALCGSVGGIALWDGTVIASTCTQWSGDDKTKWFSMLVTLTLPWLLA
jgi:hypothetical protein